MVKKLTARGFGARYGKSVRQKYAKVESKQRKKQACPFCKKTAKRVSKGIWKCKSCGKKFASGAYCVE
jgi:large subunit ribosomal protein L37Ae